MADHDDELHETVRELTRTVDELRAELESGRRRPSFRSSPLRPPTPREVLAFTDEIAVPAAIAVLETSVRALEAFQRTLRVARTEREVRDRTADAADATSARAADLRETTLAHLDTVLAELQHATADDGPANDRASDLLADARELRDEVDRRLREAGREPVADPSPDTGTDAIRIDVESGPLEDETPDTESHVDVDAELETLKDRYSDEDDGAADDDPDEPESDGAGDEPS